MRMTVAGRKVKKAAEQASRARMIVHNLETRAALSSNTCPRCAGGVHRNLALTGWVQCDGFGAEGFRKNPNAKPCDWQGFTGE